MLPKGGELLQAARAALHAPYGRIEPRVRLVAGVVWAKWALRDAELGRLVKVMGPLDVESQGQLSIGGRTYFLPGVFVTRLHVSEGALLEIGELCGFAPGATIRAHEHIRVGNGCLIASQVLIEDAPKAPICIGDGVWLAHGARVMPGVTIGDGSAVSAGTLVTKDVPAGHLAIGAPARNVKLQTLDRPHVHAIPRGNMATSSSTR
jgi:acetyltransferase-like isoleucine patch superfamily enzyme